jgi:hypothetical protein
MGDPFDEKTFLGPMIDEPEATRLTEWKKACVARGCVDGWAPGQ